METKFAQVPTSLLEKFQFIGLGGKRDFTATMNASQVKEFLRALEKGPGVDVLSAPNSGMVRFYLPGPGGKLQTWYAVEKRSLILPAGRLGEN